jgi:poly-gamma-glutamate synthesis protein (capsule biosynthesis protein)
VIVVAFASTTSGTPVEWAAGSDRPGLNVVEGLSPHVTEDIEARLRDVRRPGDVVVASVHWGSNWGYHVPDAQRRLAHELIDIAGVDVVHGHSSHHPRPIELYRGRLILHGCGDFITDYEGIAGFEEFRDDLVLAYFVTLDSTGRTVRLALSPFRLRRFQLTRPSEADVAWLADTLDRHSRAFGVGMEVASDGTLLAQLGTGRPGASSQEVSS